MADSLELTEVIEALRGELQQAQQSGNRPENHIRFNVNNVEVEFKTVVEKSVEGGTSGKLKFWVINADASSKGQYKKSATHTIKLNLSVMDENNPDPKTGNASTALLSDED